MISARVVADSVCDGARLTTMELVYPRFIHSELMTHRKFSRNSASSRAIPIRTMIAMVDEDPAMPIEWGKNQSGMQAKELVGPHTAMVAEHIWREACADAIRHAERMMDIGIHKQVANRILEPFMHMQTLVSSTEWENWWRLRISPEAQPEINQLAAASRAVYLASEPVDLSEGQWHTPYVAGDQSENARWASAMRCARVSYGRHGPKGEVEQEEVEKAKGLAAMRHMSPFEHVATPMSGSWANFDGWRQMRWEIEHVS
jgi:hypothetical protein